MAQNQTTLPAYQDLFSRNVGVLTEAEQKRLSESRVAIAGLGGVGGAYAATLARLGIGKFHIADFDIFEPANFNRQFGATIANLGRRKADVMRETILSINPHADVRIFGEGVTAENIGEFLDGVQLVMDGLDFYAVRARRILFPAAEKKGIHVVTSGPIGMTTTLHVFGPGAMPFEEYFDFAGCATPEDELVAFAVGVAPGLLHLGQVDFRKVNFQKKSAPSIGTAIQLCAGLACNEAYHVLLGRRSPFLAPRYFQFDPSKLRLKKGRLLLGNRGPIQRLKRRLMKNMIANAAKEA